jgi:hypothetical protein
MMVRKNLRLIFTLLRVPLFLTLPDSDGTVKREMLRKCVAMTSSGKLRLLIDGHHFHVYRGKEEDVFQDRTRA